LGVPSRTFSNYHFVEAALAEDRKSDLRAGTTLICPVSIIRCFWSLLTTVSCSHDDRHFLLKACSDQVMESEQADSTFCV
jgi:hypothetical protein